MQKKLADDYFALLVNASYYRDIDPETDDNAKLCVVGLWQRACTSYESGLYGEDGDLAAFIDLAEEVIASWH